MKIETELESRIKKEIAPHMGKVISISGGVDSSLLAALMKPKYVVNVQSPGGEAYNESKYSNMLVKELGLKRVVVKPDYREFKKCMKIAVKAIGRPIPHFNIFPLYSMYRELARRKVTEVILGDGPDETMSGYARNLIMYYLYKVYNFEEVENYRPTINKVLPPPAVAYAKMVGKRLPAVQKLMYSEDIVKGMNRVDMVLMRPDMDDMSNRIAAYFGIKNIRPYQDNVELDDYMYHLPEENKIQGMLGKYLLREIASKYVPPEIAWRKTKAGGPIYPVNELMGWVKKDGEFGKRQYIRFQKNILSK